MSTLTGKCMQFLGAKTPPLLAGVTGSLLLQIAKRWQKETTKL